MPIVACCLERLTSVSTSCMGNVTQQDHTDLLLLSSEEQLEEEHNEPFVPTQFESADHDYCTVRCFSLFVNNILEYIAGWVVRKLSPKIACADCLSAHVVKADTITHCDSLLEIKNNGGLVKPSADVNAVIQQAEKVLCQQVNIQPVVKQDRWRHELETRVLQQIPDSLFADMKEHFNCSRCGIDSHDTNLVRNLCRMFLTLRRFHVINRTNQESRSCYVRHALTKIIVFKHH